MSTPHPRPFYYLENFQTALAWLRQRYDDLLSAEERAFMHAFEALPQASSALLVRMIMRKGGLFRTGKLEYGEIGCPRAAAAPLIELGWLDDQPLLGLAEVFGLLRKSEIAAAFRLGARARAVPKHELMATLATTFVERRTFAAWCPEAAYPEAARLDAPYLDAPCADAPCPDAPWRPAAGSVPLKPPGD